MTARSHSSKAHKHRHGKHQKHTKRFLQVYWPYMPALLILLASLVLSGLRLPSGHGVLAYATEMSTSSLLAATNDERAESGRKTLKLNSKLSQAAQAKANDMVKRDYWSHNTPDGQEPWIFIDQTGYGYLKAGENLAYGFGTSSETVAGWMNSASHKANLLDKEFSEVGFGFANASDFQDTGKQTVVVAMYGKPQALGASAGTQQPASPPPAAQPERPAPAPEPEPVQENSALTSPEQQPVTTEQPAAEDRSSQEVTRLEALSGGRLPWATFAIGIISGTAATTLLVNHGLRLRRLIKKGNRLMHQGESFVLHHPALDLTMISLIVLALTLSRTVGTIL